MDDQELLRECRKHPEQGLQFVIDRYVHLIYAIVYRKISTVGTAEDAKECVSDVFLTFHQQIDQVDLDKGSIKVYLATIANRKAVDLYRKLYKVSVHSVQTDGGILESHSAKTNIEEDVVNKDERKILLQAIESLGEPDKEIFIRKYYLGQKSHEIAEIMNLRNNTVDKKVSRGLKKLKNLLGGELYGEEKTLFVR